MKGAAVLSVCLLLAVVGCASGENYVNPAFDSFSVQRVAVTEVEGPLSGAAVCNTIGDYFAMELANRGYTVVNRNQLRALLAEQNFQRSDLTGAEGAVRGGRILNVDALIVVNVPEFGQRVTLTATMLDAENGVTLWIGSGSASTGRVLTTATGAAVGAAAGATIGHGSGRVLAGTAGAALGGIAGYSLSPGELKATRKAVARACKSLPH